MPGTESIRHPLTRTLLVLSLTTGVVDAACYLGLGRVFAANMTGNVLLLGFGIAGSPGLSILGPLVALGAFFIGAVAGGRIGFAAGSRGAHLTRSTAVEAGIFALATLLAVVFRIDPDGFSGHLLIGLLAFAMGIRNATVRRLGVPDISTVVVTQVLAALAAESPFAGGDGKGTWRRGAAIGSMLAGAFLGALLVRTDLALVLAGAAVLGLATWFVLVPAAAAATD